MKMKLHQITQRLPEIIFLADRAGLSPRMRISQPGQDGNHQDDQNRNHAQHGGFSLPAEHPCQNKQHRQVRHHDDVIAVKLQDQGERRQPDAPPVLHEQLMDAVNQQDFPKN